VLGARSEEKKGVSAEHEGTKDDLGGKRKKKKKKALAPRRPEGEGEKEKGDYQYLHLSKKGKIIISLAQKGDWSVGTRERLFSRARGEKGESRLAPRDPAEGRGTPFLLLLPFLGRLEKEKKEFSAIREPHERGEHSALHRAEKIYYFWGRIKQKGRGGRDRSMTKSLYLPRVGGGSFESQKRTRREKESYLPIRGKGGPF